MSNVTLTADLPAVQKNVTIVGNNHTLSGGGTYRGFLVANLNGGSTLSAVTVTIKDLTITNTKASGGAGGGLNSGTGGGGAGLGSAIFVADQADVTVSNVTLTSNAAVGGNGGAGVGSGAGGWAAPVASRTTTLPWRRGNSVAGHSNAGASGPRVMVCTTSAQRRADGSLGLFFDVTADGWNQGGPIPLRRSPVTPPRRE